MKKYPVAYNPILEYWAKIESGEEVVGDKVRRIYKKLAADVYDQNSVYEYDPKRANHAIEFMEHFCKHSKGKWAGQPIELELWQKAWIAAVFGFVHKIDGTRKYRETLLIVARKNGKSTLSSGICLYLMVADGEGGAEVYAVATKEQQAKIVWQESKRMVKKSPVLSKRIKTLVKELNADFNDSVFKPVGSDSDTLDGLNVHGASLDEIHAWKDKNLYDVIVDGTSAREQPLILMITTAGTVRESVYDQKYSEAEMLLNGFDDPEGYKDDRFLPVIYELDDREEWKDPRSWKKANPGLGTIKKVDNLETKVNKAKSNTALVKNLLTKDFNIPETSLESWLSFSDIVNDHTFDIEELRGCYAVAGTDLSSTTDLTAATLLIQKRDSPMVYVLQKYFIPEELIERKIHEDKIPYDIWIEKGYVEATAGHKVDYSRVTAWYMEMINKYDIRPLWLGYDSWNSQYWTNEMMDAGFEMEEVRQGAKTMSQPMKLLAAALKANEINYNKNPVLKWCLSNTSIKTDDNENIRPVKGLSQKMRIDGAVSLIIAYVLFQKHYTDYTNMM
ncbi:terminase large subunit [Priestia endophytica]|uniref:terminase large subunit n=1 Tax=Priestia endophytica TaxID=135735 RepID=UPI002040B682|nr:terminase TerL endonuclease subunit [Priestia endophytica]MCM3536586.1 terminase large subunit [Priestia endophytica]